MLINFLIKTGVLNYGTIIVIFVFLIPFASDLNSQTGEYHKIKLPVFIYILDDRDGILSSSRTKREISSIFENVNRIWSQANIEIVIKQIQRLSISHNIIEEFTIGNYEPFLDPFNRSNSSVDISAINAFYAIRIGGPNGIALSKYRIFLVTDNPFVYDHRVTSHEIGHLIGLGHDLYDPKRLMYSGTNGTELTKQEIIIARKYARLLSKINE